MVKRSIFRKLLVTMVGLIITLLMMLTIVQIQFQKDVFELELDKRIVLMKERLIDGGHILSDNLSGQVKNGIASANISLVAEQLRKAVQENKELHYIILMEATGKAYIHTLKPQLEMSVLSEQGDLFAAAQKTATVNEYVSDGKPIMEFIMPIQVSSEPWGMLRLGFSLDTLNQEIVNSRKESSRQIREIIKRLLITTTIFILIGACIVLLVSERLSRPLMHLTRLANELAQGDFSVSDKVTKIRPDGEIGELTAAFVQMAGNLKISYDKLEEYSRTLEQKVINRTDELAKARDRAIAADKSKSEFLSMMSHEIRTPMNAIIGMTRLALQTDLTAKQQDYLAKVQTSSRALLGIINDVLDFSKIEAGKLELETIPFNLDDVLSDLANLTTDKAEEKGLQIHFSIEDDVPLELIGDPLRLGQVLLNLVSNAIKFTRHGEIFIKVALEGGELAKRADQVGLEFSVKDTGIGLTTEQIGGLFQSFSQADKSTTREYGGTGLGLAICRRIVAMMNGDIHVDSEIGQGSTFIFTAVFGQLLGGARKRAASRDAFRGVKALVVDADAASRDVLSLCLETFFFQVAQAGTAEQAIQLLENAPVENPYQLVLMDWNLPKMDGITAARQINSSLKIARVPHIIMMTAYNREDIAPQLTDFNLDGFLAKPVHPSALFNAVVDVFDQQYLDGSPVLQARSLEFRNEGLDKIKGAQLLLVEDNYINQQVAKETLEQEGFAVTLAQDGQDAVQKIREGYFDAVLMDLQMPVMDGYQATRIIRSDAKFDDLPIIAMTAHALSDVRERCLHMGMNGYVTKPLDVDELLASLVDLIKPKGQAAQDSCLLKPSPQRGVLLPEFLPGIEMRQALKNVVGNEQLFCDLLGKFHQRYSDAQIRLDAFLQSGDVDSALKLLHAMKGVTANLAMPELRSCIVALEQSLKSESKYEPELLARFSSAQSQVLESIGQLLGTNDRDRAQ